MFDQIDIHAQAGRQFPAHDSKVEFLSLESHDNLSLDQKRPACSYQAGLEFISRRKKAATQTSNKLVLFGGHINELLDAPRACRVPQLAQGLRFDLANPLPRYVELTAHLF